MIRKIIQIDEEKCDGCGVCASACAEGAIRIIAGKARLVSEQYCDGLGVCLGECPQGAIEIIERDAEDFSETAVARHLTRKEEIMEPANDPKPAAPAQPHSPLNGGGCPGARMMFWGQNSPSASETKRPGAASVPAEEADYSALRQWPIQLHLVPIEAPFFENRELLIAADCTAFALGAFHRQLLEGRALAIACPKLDDSGQYVQKLAAILARNHIYRIHVAIMAVPCCRGLAAMVKEALALSEKDIPLEVRIVEIPGK